MAQTRSLEEISGEILRESLGLGALRYGEFRLSSGGTSRFYFDGRLLTLSPNGAALVGEAMLRLAREAGAEAIGGPTLGADPMVTAVALLSGRDDGKPVSAFIVRKEQKAHGTANMIEGPVPTKARVVIVDDTCSTGSSLVHAIEAAESMGCEVALVAVILDRNQGGSRQLKLAGYPFHALLEADADGQIKLAGSNPALDV